MPGKYSYGVVLADFSNRGMITLPPEQRDRYSSLLSQPDKLSAAQIRARGTRSAQAIYRQPLSPERGLLATPADRPHPSLSPVSAPSKNRVRVREDDDAEALRPLRYSQYYELIPHNTAAINIVPQSAQKAAYERQQQRSMIPGALPIHVEYTSGLDKRGDLLSLDGHLARPVFRNSRSNISLRKDAKTDAIRVRERERATTSSGASSSTHMIEGLPSKVVSSAPRLVAPASHDDWRASPARGSSPRAADAMRPKQRYIDPQFARTSPLPRVQEAAETPGKAHESMSNSNSHSGALTAAQRPTPNETRYSTKTQITGPKPILAEKPDFDGFSDDIAAPPGYSDLAQPAAVHSRSSNMNSTLITQRPESRAKPKGHDKNSNAAPTATPQTASSQTVEHSTSSGTTASSTMTSSRLIGSDSSISSINGLASALSAIKGKGAVESPRRAVHGSSLDHSWRLPQIQEDHGFSPSIFEDKEGNGGAPMIDLEGLGSIGQISSGKDITFDDAASDLSAAMPPPISKFKNEEDEFNSNMAKLFGLGGEVATPKKGSHAIGRASIKMSKGFLSKFRSKSQLPGK